MSDAERKTGIAVVGAEDLVYGFRALGFDVFSPADTEEARQILKDIGRGGYALCLLHQSLFEPLQAERAALAGRFLPVVVGFSDFRSAAGTLDAMLREMAVKATGSDSLVKRKD